MQSIGLFNIIWIAFVTAQTWTTVSCDSTLASGVCYVYDEENDRIHLREWEVGYKWDIDDSNSIGDVNIDKETHRCVLENYIADKKYAGETCLDSSECWSN